VGEVVPFMGLSHMGVLDHQVDIQLQRFPGDLLIAGMSPVDPAVDLVTLIDQSLCHFIQVLFHLRHKLLAVLQRLRAKVGVSVMQIFLIATANQIELG
jgi:hypothetical protein